MEPQQPGQLGHNPYDFILNPPKPAAQHPAGGKLPLPKIGGGSFGKQIAVIVGSAVALMILIAIIASAFGGSNLNTDELDGLVASQAELVNVATLGSGMVTTTANQRLAINIQLTLKTDQNNLVSFLASEGIKVSDKQLQADTSTATNLQLQNAQANSTADVVFAQITKNQLQSYSNSLKTTYNQASNPTLKKLLSTDFTQAQLLLKEVPTT